MPLIGVLGDPVAHSRSPAMQNAALRAAGLDGWHYEALRVTAEQFDEVVRGLPGHGWVGANVTIPHKLRALALADQASEAAEAIGAANTLSFTAGRILAENTDWSGLRDALAAAGRADLSGAAALVLGAGGSARAVVYALLQAGVGRIWLWNRTPERARELVERLGARLDTAAVEPAADPDAVLGRADLVVNTTAVGLDPGDDEVRTLKELHISADNLGNQQTLVDLVYGQVDTPLVRVARERGAVCIDGLEVLVRQGARSFELWTGRRAPYEAMRLGARGDESQGQGQGQLPQEGDPPLRA